MTNWFLTSEVKVCLPAQVLAEYYEVANRQRFLKYAGFSLKANELIESIKENALWFEPKEAIKILPDEDDDKFLELPWTLLPAILLLATSMIL